MVSGMRDVQRQSSGMGSQLKTMGKVAVAAGGAAGLGILVATLHTGVQEMSDAAKVGAQTDAVLKSTGESAHVSAKHVADLAGSLLAKSGVDDEAIQSGENLLLTFTKIQNQAGKGNKIFDRATTTMLDMSVALGQDTKASAIQLGKALNDPIKGVTALQRVGVSFTESQKAQIKALVESGDTLGAQKLILRELNKEFGGSAKAAGKTLPGQINILRESFNNLAGELVQKLVPTIQKVTKLFVEHPALLKAVVFGVLALSAAFVALNAVFMVTAIVTAPISIWFIAIPAIILAVVAAAFILWRNWDKIMRALKAGAQAVFSWLKSNWPLLLGILTGPLGLAVVLVIRNWDKIKQATTQAWNAIKGAVGSVLSVIRDRVGTFLSWFGTAWNGAKAVLQKVAGWFDIPRDAATAAVRAIKGAFSGLVADLSNIVGGIAHVAGRIASAIKAPVNAVIRGWNALALTFPKVELPSVNIPHVGKIGGQSFGGWRFPFPQIAQLARGGIVTSPTLAVVGERGPEAVLPLGGAGGPTFHVRVFLGDTELRDLVRIEAVAVDNATAAALMGGLA